jgi:NADH-quinone oxidoreductase subunit E
MVDTRKIDGIIERYRHKQNPIIEIMQDVQKEWRYLPQDVLIYISDKTGTPLSHIHHIATFYRAFSLKEKGRHRITVCMGTACHVRGAQSLLEDIERQLEIRSGDTTPDMRFSLETVNCVGACAMAPVLILDEKYHGNMGAMKTRKLISGIEDHEEEAN